jgi:hypothetical protein
MAAACAGGGAPEDYTRADPRKLGISPVPARKDPKTGFVVAGRNATTLIRRLTEIAGRPIADLERDMRPGRLSTAGFLGRREKLLDVLAADNHLVVEDWGLTHQEVARHLHLAGAVAVRHAVTGPKEFLYHGRRYKVKAKVFRGFVDSPFEDCTKANSEVTVWNLDTSKSLGYSLLLPHMIERYGFYEGHDTRFRVEPRAVVEVFDFLKKKGR